jgi:hypothetical protein
MSEVYYLRWRGLVSGPFPAEEIRNMLAEARITKHHQVSTDRQLWMPLFESEWFISDCRGSPAPQRSEPAEAQAPSGIHVPSKSQGVVTKLSLRAKLKKRVEALASDTTERWYYAENGESMGPVSADELRSLVASGRIDRDTFVCKEGEQQWENAGERFPDFWASAVPAHGKKKETVCRKCGFRNQDGSDKCGRCGEVLQYEETPQKIPNYLAQSILVTLFCCIPLGIPAIVYSAQVNGRIQAGDIQGAMEASRKANAWGQWGLGVGFLAIVAYFLLQFAGDM